MAGPTKRGAAAPARDAIRGVFRREGDVWTLSLGGRTTRAKDAKGLRYIARLLERPGSEMHALDLATVDGGPSSTHVRADDDLHVSNGSVHQEALDPEARAAYAARVAELEADIEDAGSNGNTVAAERARDERDAIVAELSAAYGLGGRARALPGDTTERARKAVTERIRTTLARIEKVHPELGEHLRRSIRTGTYCSYAPETAALWELHEEPGETPAPRVHGTPDVVIVDDHPLWRDTLRKLLEHAGAATVVGEASDGAGAVDLVRRSRPDVVLMDMGLPDSTGSDITKALVGEWPDIKVLVLSSSDERREVVAAVAAGASGYLVKTADAHQIVDALRRIHAGELVFPPPVGRMVLEALQTIDARPIGTNGRQA